MWETNGEFMNKPGPIAEFNAEERAFREVQDSSDYLDRKQVKQVPVANLKPSSALTSLRIPRSILIQDGR